LINLIFQQKVLPLFTALFDQQIDSIVGRLMLRKRGEEVKLDYCGDNIGYCLDRMAPNLDGNKQLKLDLL
jgi:hypothetical protein